jgi:hypothetical protein
VTEPEYVYRKGEGWVLTFHHQLGVGDVVKEWIQLPGGSSSFSTFTYPSFCRDYKVIVERIPASDLRVGDVIPYTPNEARLIVSLDSRITCVRFLESRPGSTYYFPVAGNFRCVARP